MWLQGSPVSIWVVMGSKAILSNHGSRIRPQDALKGESRSLSRLAAGDPGFPRFVMVTSGTFSWCLWEVRNTVVLGGSSRDSTWVSALEDVSSRVEAGTSVFLSCSDVSLRVCMPFQTGSQVSTCVEAWNCFPLQLSKGFQAFRRDEFGTRGAFQISNQDIRTHFGL